MNEKVLINFCPTGMVPTKDLTPFIPITPSEIVEQTHEAYELGITMAHLHARDESGAPTYRAEVYEKIVSGVRKHCPGLIICLSTSGRTVNEFEKRSEVIELRPDFCSLTLSSLNFLQSSSVNSPQMIDALLNKMGEFGVRPELECFDLGMVNYGLYLIEKYQLDGPHYWNIILGNIAGAQPDFAHLAALLGGIPCEDRVSLGAVGSFQLETVSLAIAKGLGVRVGLEDNIWWDRDRTRLATNRDLVSRVHDLLHLNQRSFLSSEEFNQYNHQRA